MEIEIVPKGFDDCIKRGGRVRTKKLSGGKFMHICFINGKSFPGDVKERKRSIENKFSKGLKE